jgi:hypothetical protein
MPNEEEKPMTTELIDYAAPMMRVEKLLKEMHNSLLDKDMITAHEKALALIVESRVLCNTLILMKEQETEHALRQQTKTVQERV